MKGRRLLTLSALALAFACEDQKAPTGPAGLRPPANPSAMISDGAHGGNPDFFFLPPLVPNPVNDPNYDRGKANNALEASLAVEICELGAAPVDALGHAVATDCVAGPPLKRFAPGTGAVRQQGSADDGFYMAQWKTKDSNLNLSKFYRIKVFVDGAHDTLGIADLDPVASQKELKNARTGEVIPLLDDGTLPIKFRVETGALCHVGVALCNSVTVTNNSPTGFQIVTVDGGAGAIAGAKFPNGWLPSTGPQSVVVTIASVNTGTSNPATGTETTPCHGGLVLEQFPGCFNFTTTPALTRNDSGDEFATSVIVAVCYSLQGSGDPREKFAEMYSSGPNELPHALPDAPDVGILGPAARNCTTNVIGSNNSKGVTGLASAAWRKVKGGLGQFFGVQTAYAVDLGLGGFSKGFSNVGPALSARLEPISVTEQSSISPVNVGLYVRIVGNNHHGEQENSVGLGGLPVTWTIAPGNGFLSTVANPDAESNQVTVITNPNDIDIDRPGTSGFAEVNWRLPTAAGTYTLTATGPTIGGPVTFTYTVLSLGLNVLAGTWVNENPETGNNTRDIFSIDGNAVFVHAFGACSPQDCDWGTVTGDTSAWLSTHKITAVWNQGFVVSTQTIEFISSERLTITTHYDFTPEDGRTDFSATENFTREAIP